MDLMLHVEVRGGAVEKTSRIYTMGAVCAVSEFKIHPIIHDAGLEGDFRRFDHWTDGFVTGWRAASEKETNAQGLQRWQLEEWED